MSARPIPLLLIGLAIAVPLSLLAGRVWIDPFAPETRAATTILMELRLPRALLAVIIGFTAAAPKALGAMGAPITVVAAIAAVLITFLELFVAFLQAFIFMFLTTLFIAQLAHHHHDDDAHAESYDKQNPAIDDPAAPVTA